MKTAQTLYLTAALCAAVIGGWAQAPSSNSAPLKYEEPRFLTASILSKEGGRRVLLFNFKRQATRSGNTLRVVREYTYPDGKPAAREHLVYEGDDLVLYTLEELQIGASGRAEVRPESRDHGKSRLWFEYPSDSARPKTASEAFQKNTLVNDMVGPFLLSHREALLAGKEIKCRYIVVPRRETVGFTFKKEAESTWQGWPAVIVRMEATSPIIAALVDPLFFTIEKSPPHRVLEYSGRTTAKINSGGKWKDLDAVTVFDWPR